MNIEEKVKKNMTEEKFNCIKCIHFYITWDQRFPNGCKLFGFKTRLLPASLVRNATGGKCSNFVEKPKA